MVFRAHSSNSQEKLISAFAQAGKSLQKLVTFQAMWAPLGSSTPSALEGIFDKSNSTASAP